MTKRSKKTTLHDIASRQQVSHTTVSFALRGKQDGISQKKRQEILQEAIKLSYHARPDKRIDTQKRKVLFLVPEYTSIYGQESYASRLVAYLLSTQDQSKVELIVQSSVDRNIIRSLYKGICEEQVDVVIPINLGLDEIRTVVELSPVPVICMDLWANVDCSIIGFDHDWIGREAAKQFFDRGHRSAAAFTSSIFIDIRATAFIDQWKIMGGKITPINFESMINLDAIYNKMSKFMKKAHDLTAIFCGNDPSAMAVMQAMYDNGLSVPDDISLIGCDDHTFCTTSHPSLSTFRMDEKKHGQQLIAHTHQLVENPDIIKIISNKATFIERESIRSI